MKLGHIILILTIVAVLLLGGVYTVASYVSYRSLGTSTSPSSYFGFPVMWWWSSSSHPRGTSSNSVSPGPFYNNMMTSFWSNASYYPFFQGNETFSWMLQHYGWMMTTANIQAISLGQIPTMMNVVPAYANIIRANDTIRFSEQSTNSIITVIAFTAGGDLAKNLTGATSLPSYSIDNVFVIYGLINPTLVIPRGQQVNFIVINLDDSDYHNLDVTTASPPYAYMPMMASEGGSGGGPMMYYGGFAGKVVSTMPMLPPTSYSTGTSYEASYNLTSSQTGVLWYFCSYPGHAQSGMYGKIMIV